MSDTAKQTEEREVEQTLISLKRVFEKEIAKHEQAKKAADDRGAFGMYRYQSGVIDGLKDACSTITDDYLADLWGM